jgi:hypothetical protein
MLDAGGACIADLTRRQLEALGPVADRLNLVQFVT